MLVLCHNIFGVGDNGNILFVSEIGASYVDQSGLELIEIHLPLILLNTGIKGVCHHARSQKWEL